MITTTTPEHVDVLIVGAGISGLGAAYHLQDKHPDRSFAILEGREAPGGTWDMFRYPGIRSDSDLATFGYAFKPWTGEKAIADGPAILEYLREMAAENDIERHIRYQHRVLRACFDSDEGRWTVEATRTDTGEQVRLTCGWLFCASGYYRYDEGYTPEFEGRERFGGELVHPQHWPEDLDYRGKRVVVIGSGATAVTLVPAMAGEAEHVTMLQRSPTYIISFPAKDAIGNALRRVFGDRAGHRLTRGKNVRLQRRLYKLSRRHPALMRRLIRASQRVQLPKGYDLDTHFTPRYDPWDQRLCLVPNGDLFKAISAGDASVLTDQIETLTETGIRLRSGAELEADVIVTATGLNMLAFGGIELAVDGEEVEIPEATVYKGMMLSGVPNFAFAFGYTNASWTLKVDLVCEYLCRLLSHLDATGQDQCVPEAEPTMTTGPMIDFAAGYMQRGLAQFPRQGASLPWRLSMDYDLDVRTFGTSAVEDGAVRFAATPAPALAADELPALVAA
jgi:cation diffusion facilitator CzcD-associated flavoprotein CzcO